MNSFLKIGSGLYKVNSQKIQVFDIEQ